MYNLCEALPEEALQAIVRRVKARGSTASDATAATAGDRVQGSIDRLATSYSERLRELRHKASSSNSNSSKNATLAFSWFLEYLCRMESLFGAFTSEARAIGGELHEPACRMAWNALVYESFGDEGAGWLEAWIHLSLHCVLRIVANSPELILRADLGDLGSEGAARIRSICEAAEERRHGGGGGDVDEGGLYWQVGDSEASTLHFLSELARGCRLLRDLSILDTAHSAVWGAATRMVCDNVGAQESQWEEAALLALLQSVCHAAGILDVLLANPPARSLADHVESHLYAQFSALRVSELFSIIVDYPDSRAAIDDLRTCVAKLGNMRQVAVSLRDSVQQRLLHPGATTGDILTQYISAIRCLRLLDPSSTMLEVVAQPIRSYLRSRDNTVPCIVQDMVSAESELFEDLASGPAVLLDSTPEGVVYDEEYSGRDWEPLPVEAKSTYRTAQRRDADVLSLLVSIYDTRDVFVQEFEAHLAQSLLECEGYDTTREIKQVEMMKLRFGGPAMERCEVMLKDMADSKRINQSVAESGRCNPVHQATVVSRQFWAPATMEQYALPPPMAAMRGRYAAEFESLKPARKLEWRDAQALVTLRIQLEDRTVELDVRPAQAAVLFAFQDASSLTLAEVAQALECSEEFALPRLRFWQTRGVLRETGQGVFETVEREAAGTGASRSPVDGSRDTDPNGAASEDGDDDEDAGDAAGGAAGGGPGARTEALRVHFNFIVGMLTNFGPLPLDRILNMLGMFLPGENTTAEELRDFLAQMVREDRLDMAGGMYKLR